MASIFLSYARDDADKAAKVAAALEAAGHKLWWDRNIGAGTRFAAEIEEALRAADRVVVLWSKTSIRSAWVLDEAAAGRDTGRLIPVLIDAVEPPLGFRQYQAIDLSGRRRGAKSLASLIAAVGGGRGGGGPRETQVARAPRSPLWKPLMIAVGVLLLIGAGWWFLGRAGQSDDAMSVGVVAGNSDPRSTDLARSIALDLSTYRAGPLGSLAILDPSDKSAAADYVVDVTASGDAAALRAGVAMRSRKAKGLLWSTTIEGEGRKPVDVRQQVASDLGNVLECLVQLRRGERQPNQEVLGLFLSACAADVGGEQAASLFRQITAKAPDLGAGWAGLAFVESEMIWDLPPGEQRAALDSARKHLALARRFNSTFPAGYVAEANLQLFQTNDPGRYLAVLDRGLATDPDSGLLHGAKSGGLRAVGRTGDGVAEARQAVDLNPVSAGVQGALIEALAVAGRTKEAFDQLDRADRTWPGSETFASTRFSLNLRYGDPNAALLYLRDHGSGSVAGSAADEAWARFLEARMNPTPAKIATALEAFRLRNASGNAPITGYIQALGTFGHVDEVYALLAKPDLLRKLPLATEVLFRAHMKSVRNDPRFMALSKQLGLVDYWQTSGHWPDFCNEPRLPYNCKAEVAKLARGIVPRG